MLYDLVSLKKALTENINADDVVKSISDLRDRIANTKFQVNNISPEHEAYIDQLVSQYDQLIAKAIEPVEQSKVKITELSNTITDVAHKLFADSYDFEEYHGGFDSIRNGRRITLNEDVEQTVKQRIMLHTNWRYPALEIGCRDGEWTQYLVAADPLYIMDSWPEFLESATSQFPAQYQARLRKYPLKNHDLSALPKNQFAFVFSWSHFNYVSLDTITQTLKQLQDIMRPGGIFLFSYNDGDTPEGAGMAENWVQTYIPKSILVPTCQSVGFEIAQEFNYGNVSWLEIKKPGTLHTIKAHQVLGEIKRREN
jgi:SAM-dependent methyltransferase